MSFDRIARMFALRDGLTVDSDCISSCSTQIRLTNGESSVDSITILTMVWLVTMGSVP